MSGSGAARRHALLALGGAFLSDVSCGLPLFLMLRERALPRAMR